MKILHTENSQGWGGQEIRILSEMRGLMARGHTLELACAPGACIEQEACRAGIPVTVLPIANRRVVGMLALRRFIAAHGFDVINTHSSTDSWLTALACATLSNAPPIVRTRHISAPVPANAATRWLYTLATRRIVTTGEALKHQLVRDNGFPAGSIVSIPTGIELTRFVPRGADADVAALRRQAGVPPDRRVIGIVATLRSWKGHRFVVEAFAALNREDLTLLIVGDGPQREALEGLVAGLELGDRVVFAGNQADVVPWLHAIDVFALPSYANEGVPQAILQAFACALPVVTTDAGAIGEVARDGETALVVQKENPADLARGLARALDDHDLARTLGANALALVHARHGHAAMLDAMEAVFRAAIDDR